MRKFIKNLLIITGILFILAIVGFSVTYLKYRSLEKQDLQAKYIKTSLVPGREVSLGKVVAVNTYFTVPWDKKPVIAEILPGKGSQLIGIPQVEKTKTRWGNFEWKIQYRIQPVITGKIPESVLKIDFVSGNKVQNITLKSPVIISSKITSLGNELLIAPKLNKENQILSSNKLLYSTISIVVIICIIILLIVFLKLKKRNGEVVLTPWAIAIKNLKALSDSYSLKEIAPAKCMTRLTDIVREYLETRFSLHAQRQTTEEFLRSMEDTNSPLENKDRNFLKEFMVSADMVKFAKYEASRELINNSIDRAMQLVNKTIPDEKISNNQKRMINIPLGIKRKTEIK